MSTEEKPDELTERLRDEVSLPAGDDDRIATCLKTAREYVKSAISGQQVSQTVEDDCIVSCASDLYNSRSAKLGVMDVADSETQPFRISTDPLRSV